MYSFKEKKIHYNRLQNSSAATADLKLLLSINPDAPILPAWGRCPERFANKILYLLLDYATAEEIRKNRRTPVKSEKEKLEETKQELQEAASELEETKEMVMRNICFLLNNFLRCTAYDNIILCWVMHEQYIIDSIINELDTSACRVIKISLMTDETNLRNRLSSDIARGLRTADVIDRSVGRIRMYQLLDTVQIDTSNKTVREIADEILKL